MAASAPAHGALPASNATPRALVAAVVALFFIWGGLTSLNDILIPKLKGMFALSYTEAMFSQFAFFMAYFLVSLPAGALIARVGYVRGIVIGLVTMAIGCLLFIPASSSGVYTTFLGALFVLAAGITILQVAANPLIARLGSAETAHSRLTLAQGFNALGTTLFPPIGAAIILGSLTTVDPALLSAADRTDFLAREAGAISFAYVIIAFTLAAVAGYFWRRRNQLSLAAEASSSNLGDSLRLLGRPRLGGGVVAIFLYVGAEVAIGSMLVNYLAQPSILGIGEKAAGSLLALYWGGAMVGRFGGAWLLRRIAPGLLLACFAIAAVALVTLSGFSSGSLAGFSLLAVGLFNSIMFPTIFSLGIEGLGDATPQGSGLLCMGIVGGAIIPLLLGLLADAAGLSAALGVPALCYIAIASYGWSVRRAAVAPI
jgi:FHS family L-fucose permease-like MFS transporter